MGSPRMMGIVVSARQFFQSSSAAAVVVAAGVLLTGCQGGNRTIRLPWQTTPPPSVLTIVPTVDETAPTAVATAPLDPINADPINAPAPVTAQAGAQPSMAGAMLVPAPSAVQVADSSQRVPLGTLGPAAPAGGAPTSLTQQPQAAPTMQQAVPAAPPQQVAAAPEPAKPVPPPSVTRDAFRTSVISTPTPLPSQAAPVLRPPLVPAGSNTRVVEQASADDPTQPTVVISSASAPPIEQGREFVPASIVPGQILQPNLIIGDIPMTSGQKNVVQRFETLRRLLDESLITQDEYNRRRNTNIGALLPYTHQPGGIALERSVPGSDAIIARLSALRRAFEMRAISASQHALERNMILNALLPETPEERADQRPPPADVLEGAAMAGHLEGFRAKNLITAAEFTAERDAIEYALKNGLLPSQDLAAKKPTPAKAGASKPAPAKAATTAAAEADPMTTEITGPVLHLASFRTEEAARRAWTEATGRNKAAFASLKPIIRRVDLGTQGIFFRLMAGTFTSMGDAEATCIQLKQNNQFCRASADGS